MFGEWKHFSLPTGLRHWNEGMLSYLRTIGEGMQNLLNVFFIFSCKAFSSRHQVVGSAADGPAVGSMWHTHNINSILQFTNGTRGSTAIPQLCLTKNICNCRIQSVSRQDLISCTPNFTNTSTTTYSSNYTLRPKAHYRQLSECSPPRTPFGHIWALIWSGVRGNIARTAL